MTSLRPDELPWLDIARAVNNGRWDEATGSTLESLRIGLESVGFRCGGPNVVEPECRDALDHINELQLKPKKQRKK